MSNELVDYSLLTRFAIECIHTNLRLPVAVVTDNSSLRVGQDHTVLVHPSASQNMRYFHEYDKTVPWNNEGRELAFDLSPFRHTFLLDVDYLCLSPNLLKYRDLELGMPHLLLNYGEDTGNGVTCFGNTFLPQFWASVVVFDKTSSRAHRVFETWKQMKRNWPFHATVFGLNQSLFRNDYVATAALLESNAADLARCYADPVLNIPLGCAVNKVSPTSIDITASEFSRSIAGYDVHVQNKKDLENAVASYYGLRN